MLSQIVGVIIPAGESLSNGVNCNGILRIVRIIVLDGFMRAPLTFQISQDDVEYHDLFHVITPGAAFNAYEVIVPNAAAGSTMMLPVDLGGDIPFVKVRSGTRTVPVVQQQDCEFKFEISLPDPTARFAASGRIEAQRRQRPQGPVGL